VALRGLHSHLVRIISLYQPCKADAALSTYQQHLRTLGKLKRDVCPKQAILDDLAKEIMAWQEAGDTVIIAADFNDDVQADPLKSFFSQFGMSAVHPTLHGVQSPVTHNRGTLPINGILFRTP